MARAVDFTLCADSTQSTKRADFDRRVGQAFTQCESACGNLRTGCQGEIVNATLPNRRS